MCVYTVYVRVCVCVITRCVCFLCVYTICVCLQYVCVYVFTLCACVCVCDYMGGLYRFVLTDVSSLSPLQHMDGSYCVKPLKQKQVVSHPLGPASPGAEH